MENEIVVGMNRTGEHLDRVRRWLRQAAVREAT